MKTPSCCAILLALFCFSCHQPQSSANGTAPGSAGIGDSLAAHMEGSYEGHYSKGLITLVINYISGNIASGYDFHKGLRRNLNGQVSQKGAQLVFEMKEPGGNPYDGTFFFSLDTASQKITGKWVPGDSTKAHEGPMTLARTDKENRTIGGDSYFATSWRGDLGDLSFLDEGVCHLEYYPKKGDNSQMITVRGNRSEERRV